MPELSLSALRGLLPQMAGANFGVAGPQELADMPLTGLDRAARYALPFSAQARPTRDETVRYTTASPYVNITEGDIGRATDAAMATSGGGLGIKAYHSSPHDFDKFDLSKIGTGEGAQVYGHGLYFAENPAVSGQGGDYWRQFALRFQGPGVDPVLENAVQILEGTKGNRAAALSHINQALDNVGPTAYPRAHMEAVRDLLASDKQVGPRTYEVNINADPAHFLDWDKPLRDQQEIVKKLYGKLPEQEYATNYAKAVHDMGGNADAAHSAIIDLTHNPGAASNDASWKVLTEGPQPKGFDLNEIHDTLRPTYFDRFDNTYHPRTGRDVEGGVRDPQAVQELAAKGIPGIKYLDEGSRGPSPYNIIPTPHGNYIFDSKKYSDLASAQQAKAVRDAAYEAERTRNFVVFDPSKIDILKKYGLAGLAPLAGLGAVAGQQQGSPQQ